VGRGVVRGRRIVACGVRGGGRGSRQVAAGVSQLAAGCSRRLRSGRGGARLAAPAGGVRGKHWAVGGGRGGIGAQLFGGGGLQYGLNS
jgi:hypothetical protein